MQDQLYRLILHSEQQLYALQTADGHNYPLQKGHLTPQLVQEHLEGGLTLGVRLLQTGTDAAKAGCIDIDIPRDAPDLPSALEIGLNIQRTAHQHNLMAYLEFSGARGFHVWLFSQAPLPGKTWLSALKALAEKADFQAREIFPHEAISAKETKCIKLPCGVNRKSGKRSGFLLSDVFWKDGFPLIPQNQGQVMAEFQKNSVDCVAALASSLALKVDLGKNKTDGAGYSSETYFPANGHPSCINHLLHSGAPANLDYNNANLTLARYVITRGLEKRQAVDMAVAMARATPIDHPTSKGEDAKISNFKSVLNSAQRNPEKYQWACSYALAGVDTHNVEALASRGCTGAKCPSWRGFRGSHNRIPDDIKGTKRQSGLNQKIWQAITALADRGAEVRHSLILAELENLDEPAVPDWRATEADEMAERELLAYILQNPEEGLEEALRLEIPEAGFVSRSDLEPGVYLKSLLEEPVCLPKTFIAHLYRVKDTGLRVMATSQVKQAEVELSDRRQVVADSLDRLLVGGGSLLRQTSSEIQPMEEHLPNLLEDLFSKPQNAIPSPSQWLNRVLNGGWLPGRFYVVGAPPGAGKTTFCAWAADYAAITKIPVLYVAYEMGKDQLWAYALSRLSGINSGLIEAKRWLDEAYKTPAERDALIRDITTAATRYSSEVSPYMTILEAGPEYTPAKLKGAIAQVRHSVGLEPDAPVLVVVDYLQLVQSGDDKLDMANIETLRVSRVATSLKQLARDTGAAVIAISDINKQAYLQAVSTGSLDMSALRDSFRIAHAADSILLLQTGKVVTGKGENAQQLDQLQLAVTKYSTEKARQIEKARIQNPLSEATKDTYARLSILKNRGGVLADPLFVYQRALHRFKPIDLNIGEVSDEYAI